MLQFKNCSFSNLCTIDGSPLDDQKLKPDDSGNVNFFELVERLPFSKEADETLFKLFPFTLDGFADFRFLRHLSIQEQSATTRALFDFKLWQVLVSLIQFGKKWNVSRNIVAWVRVSLLNINGENDAAPNIRLWVRRLIYEPVLRLTKHDLIRGVLGFSSLPAYTVHSLRKIAREAIELDWIIPIANSPEDIPCIECIRFKLTHHMNLCEDGVGSPFFCVLAHFVTKFTPIHGENITFTFNDITMDRVTRQDLLVNRRRVALNK